MNTLTVKQVNVSCRTVFGLHETSDKDAVTIFNGISSWFATFNFLLAFPIIPKVALMIPDWLTGRFIPGYMCIRQVRHPPMSSLSRLLTRLECSTLHRPVQG